MTVTSKERKETVRKESTLNEKSTGKIALKTLVRSNLLRTLNKLALRMRYNDHKESLTIINCHKTVLNVLEVVQKVTLSVQG